MAKYPHPSWSTFESAFGSDIDDCFAPPFPPQVKCHCSRCVPPIIDARFARPPSPYCHKCCGFHPNFGPLPEPVAEDDLRMRDYLRRGQTPANPTKTAFQDGLTMYLPLVTQLATMFFDAQKAKRADREDDLIAETRLKIAAEAVAVAAELGASPDQIREYVKEYRLALNNTLQFHAVEAEVTEVAPPSASDGFDFDPPGDVPPVTYDESDPLVTPPPASNDDVDGDTVKKSPPSPLGPPFARRKAHLDTFARDEVSRKR